MRSSAVPRSASPVYVVETRADDDSIVNMYVSRAGDVYYAQLYIGREEDEFLRKVYTRQYSGRNIAHLHEELEPLRARPHTSAGDYATIPTQERKQ